MGKNYPKQGYEGIIIRSPNAPYKFGRSTLKEQYLLKLKRFVDAEARIIGFIPRYENNNPLEYDNLGYAKRSTRKENLIELPMLGAFQCVGINGQFASISFDVGSGLTDKDRYTIWANKEQYKNKIITYTYQKCGSMNKPRILTFKCFREDSIYEV
jgi:DNA ligase-1